MIFEKTNHDPTLKTIFPALAVRGIFLNKEYEKLNATLSDYQKAYENDVRNEDNLIAAYEAFSTTEDYYEALLNEWVKIYPSAYQPYLARGFYFMKLGWKSRGGKFAKDTTEEQLEGMRKYFSKASQDIESALKIKQDHVIPYYLLINIYKTRGIDSLDVIIEKALEQCPGSFRIRSAYLVSITPRWGGTYEKMDLFAKNSQKYSIINPKVKVLNGYVFFDQGSMEVQAKNYGVALDLLNKALSFGDLAMFYDSRAEIYRRLGKTDEALKDTNASIELISQNAKSFYRRSRIHAKKDMFREALKDIEIAAQLDPNDEDIIELKKDIAKQFIYLGYTQEKAKNLTGAIENYNLAIQTNPNDPSSYYRRAQALIEKKEMTSVFNDLDKAIELNPNNIDYYKLMDWVLAQKSDWNSIITYWDKYIALNPDNDRAYLERGGAYFRKGDMASAVADAKRAADLGNADGRKVYERYKSQVK